MSTNPLSPDNNYTPITADSKVGAPIDENATFGGIRADVDAMREKDTTYRIKGDASLNNKGYYEHTEVTQPLLAAIKPVLLAHVDALHVLKLGRQYLFESERAARLKTLDAYKAWSDNGKKPEDQPKLEPYMIDPHTVMKVANSKLFSHDPIVLEKEAAKFNLGVATPLLGSYKVSHDFIDHLYALTNSLRAVFVELDLYDHAVSAAQQLQVTEHADSFFLHITRACDKWLKNVYTPLAAKFLPSLNSLKPDVACLLYPRGIDSVIDWMGQISALRAITETRLEFQEARIFIMPEFRKMRDLLVQQLEAPMVAMPALSKQMNEMSEAITEAELEKIEAEKKRIEEDMAKVQEKLQAMEGLPVVAEEGAAPAEVAQESVEAEAVVSVVAE